VLLLELDGLTYAIPLRSHIAHPYCFIADNSHGQNSGLDYSKAVVIIDSVQYIDPAPVTIRQHEYNIRLIQEPGWFLNKLSKILRILQF
jgi:hypothetical protein